MREQRRPPLPADPNACWRRRRPPTNQRALPNCAAFTHSAHHPASFCKPDSQLQELQASFLQEPPARPKQVPLRSHRRCSTRMAAQPSPAPLRVGVLALQGSFREHMALLAKCGPGVEAIEVRTKEELGSCAGLIIPGARALVVAPPPPAAACSPAAVAAACSLSPLALLQAARAPRWRWWPSAGASSRSCGSLRRRGGPSGARARGSSSWPTAPRVRAQACSMCAVQHGSVCVCCVLDTAGCLAGSSRGRTRQRCRRSCLPSSPRPLAQA